MPDPDPTAITPTAATPGWVQRLIAVGLAVLGALPTSGLLGPTSPWLKACGLAVIALAAAGYGNHAVTLKKAHAAGLARGLAAQPIGGAS